MDTNYYKKYEPIDGKWYITKELGRGAFGTVFEIERRDFSQAKSALKVITIPASQSEVQSYCDENFDSDEKSVTSYFYGFVEEFINEFKLMTKLRGNSNIVSIEDYDVKKHEEGIGWDIFIRMELLMPMNKYFKENKLNQRSVIKLGIDICKALEVCQKYKIIHRDIKPSNIFVSDTGEFKLGDFGVARTLEKTSSGLSKKGTSTYMAPEVFKGEEYGSNVDIYSLGIVMYRLLNNNFEPFRKERTHNDEENALVMRLKGESMPAPANADGRLAEIVLKACSFNPKDRYESPLQMRQELESILYNETDTPIIYPEGDEIEYNPTNNISESDETRGIFDSDSNTDKTPTDDDKTEGIFDKAEDKKGLDNNTDVVENDSTENENASPDKRELSAKGAFGILFGVIAVIGIIIALIVGNSTKNFTNTLSSSTIAADVRIVDSSYSEVLSNDDFSKIDVGYNDELTGYIEFEIVDESVSKWEDAQKDNSEIVMTTYINGECIAEATIYGPIQGNTFLLSGLTKEQVKNIEALLKTSGDVSYVTSKGTLVVGVTEYEPVSYRNEAGEWTGIDCELANIFAKMLGVQVEFYEINWDEKNDLLNSKTIDCIWNGLTLTGERQNDYACSEVYMITDALDKCVVGFRKNSDLKYMCDSLIENMHISGEMENVIRGYEFLYFSPNEFKLNIGVSADFKPMEYLNENGELTGFDIDYIKAVTEKIGVEYEIVNLPFDTLLEKLSNGELDIIISSITETQERAQLCDFSNSYVTYTWENGDAVEEYKIGILKNWTGLLDKINYTIDELEADGTTETLRQKYGIKDQL